MTPLVLVHGFMGGSRQWADQVVAFGEKRDVIAVDLPGFGCNADLAPLTTIGAFADWVLAELTRRKVDQFDLLGHSMGGMIVQEMAHRAPERIRKLVLYATGSIGVLPGRFETIAESKARALADGPEATARRISATWFRDGAADPAYEGCADIAVQASSAAIAAGLDAMEAWSGAAALPQIASETLIIWGDRDRTYQWPQISKMWQEIPKAQLSVVPRCAHAVHLEHPRMFNMILNDFLG